ncbi:hypothetical protein [Cellulomonas shaoxiangyii]|uniref:Uncharacterized protein n=1 Tax=Cellulomonas shaoxiangyii TaxID=2566013 RepID=A0A4P7SHV9_9CELL|nr:hypothetical protein [Cellulomonas shaoxiangyii]QCB93600.1 hypothetical protein E5225_08530 [Cellulomonas shaoxiangyii]TGY85695.1 hypothetical protein E5226_05305 [Cellulomonas shaoxiangyii]
MSDPTGADAPRPTDDSDDRLPDDLPDHGSGALPGDVPPHVVDPHAPRWAAPGPDDDLADAAPPGVRVLDDAAALELMLRLVGPERAGPPAVWFALLDAHRRLLPVVLPITDVPLRPDAAAARQLVHVLAVVLEREAPGGSAVVAVVRAAGGDRGAFERAWAHAVVLAATDRALPVAAVVAIGEHRARVLAV